MIECLLSLNLFTFSLCITVNRERFAGLNFCFFRSFQGYRESFSVKLHIMALFKCFKRKGPQKFSCEKLH